MSPGNADKGNPEGQVVKDGGTGHKTPDNVAQMAEKAKSIGPAKSAQDGKGVNMSCTPDGQKMVG